MIDLKKELNEKFYNDLIKCDFLKDIEEMVNKDGYINIDLEDIKTISKGEIVGAISQMCITANDEFKCNIISDKKPTSALVYITADKNLMLGDVETILTRIRNEFGDVGIFYLTDVDNNIKELCKLQVLFTC